METNLLCQAGACTHEVHSPYLLCDSHADRLPILLMLALDVYRHLGDDMVSFGNALEPKVSGSKGGQDSLDEAIEGRSLILDRLTSWATVVCELYMIAEHPGRDVTALVAFLIRWSDHLARYEAAGDFYDELVEVTGYAYAEWSQKIPPVSGSIRVA